MFIANGDQRYDPIGVEHDIRFISTDLRTRWVLVFMLQEFEQI